VQLGDGVAALPLDDRTREHMDWLAADVEEAGGEAIVWVADPSTKAEEKLLRRRHQERLAEAKR
jgi:hypothetical protein